MKIREITHEDRQNIRIFDAINEIIARAGKDIAYVLIEPEHGEDLVIRPDIPQFSKNIVEQTRLPVIKVSSSNNVSDTQTFEHIQAVHGMFVGAFYDGEKPAIYTMTSGPIVASVDAEASEKIITAETGVVASN